MCPFADIAPNYKLTGVKIIRNDIIVMATYSISWFSRQPPLCTIIREPYGPWEMSSFGLLRQLHSSPPFSPSPAGLTQKMLATSFLPMNTWHLWGQSYLGAAAFFAAAGNERSRKRSVSRCKQRCFPRCLLWRNWATGGGQEQLWVSYGTSILL